MTTLTKPSASPREGSRDVDAGRPRLEAEIAGLQALADSP